MVLLNAIIKYLNKNKKEFYLPMALVLFSAGLSASIPAVYGRLVDLALGGNAGRQLYCLLGLWIALHIIISILDFIRTKKQYVLSLDREEDLVESASSHLLKLPLSFHKENKIGEVFEKISRGGSNLGNIINQVVFSTLPQLFTAVIVLMVFYTVNVKVFIAQLSIIVIFCFVAISKTKQLTKTEGKISKLYENLRGDIFESVLNTKLIKSFTAEENEAQKYRRGYEKVKKEYLFLLSVWTKIRMVQSNILEIGFVIIFGASLILMGQKEISAGQLIMIIGYSKLINGPLSNLSDNYIAIKRGLVSIGRVAELMEIEEENYKGDNLPDKRNRIEFKNVSFSYDGNGCSTLDGINFEVNEGELVALVGESGAGKSTIFDIIARFIKPSEGVVSIGGMDISKADLNSLRRKIAIVPQEVVLFNASIESNIRFGELEASGEEVVKAATMANANKFILSLPLGLKQIVGERGVKLSTGEKQRIAIARAIIKDSAILLLDEATSALDSKSEKLIQEALDKLVKGKTTLIIAHRLSTIRKADRILVLKDGKIVEQGTHEELLEQGGSYKELYDLQNT